ncbi:MAG: hypothetical protein AABZ44_08160 [Elusimicrobiota bacterium]
MADIYVVPKGPRNSFRAWRVVTSKGAKLGHEQLQALARKFFVDPVCETVAFARPGRGCIVWYKDGVYDAEGEMALYIVRKLGMGAGIERIKCGQGTFGSAKPYVNGLLEVAQWV